MHSTDASGYKFASSILEMEMSFSFSRSTQTGEIELVSRVTSSTALALKEKELNVTTFLLMSHLGKLDVDSSTFSKRIQI